MRIRRQDDTYYLTYKGSGLMIREEYNLPLTEASYAHLREKIDGILLSKTRYPASAERDLTAELDVFDAPYEGLWLVEVEFPDQQVSRTVRFLRNGLEKMSHFPRNITTAP